MAKQALTDLYKVGAILKLRDSVISFPYQRALRYEILKISEERVVICCSAGGIFGYGHELFESLMEDTLEETNSLR